MAPAELTANAAPIRCPDARVGVAFYRQRYSAHRAVRGIETPYPVGRKPRNCADAHYLAELWPERSLAARRATERWLEKLLPDVASWPVAVRIVQRVFPGTELWMLECSDAEGYNKSDPTRWVTFGGDPFSWDAWEADEVGGPSQYRPSTFKGHYRNGLDFIRARGFRVPEHLLDPGTTTAWRSMIAQAIAMGWARFTGNDNSHWSASWSSGCR